MGQEAIGCHTEVRHKLDEQHVAIGNDGSMGGAEKEWSRAGRRYVN